MIGSMSGQAQPRGIGALQHWFFERVTRAGDWPDPAEQQLVLGGQQSPQARVDIYRHAYVARLVECLADDYPALAYTLGAAAFEATCREFIAQNPPASVSLNFYGAPFADFCRARRALPDVEFMAELARLEWALVEVIHADAETLLDRAQLAQVADDEWPRLRLVPSPALRLLRCSYPVHRYYQAFVADAAPGVPQPAPGGIAVCRLADDVWRFGLEPVWLRLLEQLCEGVPLASALAAFEVAASEQDASTLQQTLSEWVAAGFFAGVALD